MTLGAVVAWSLGAGEASASPVNAENLRTDSETQGWSGSVDVRGNGSVGNVRRLDLGYGGAVKFMTHHPEGVGYGRQQPPPDAPPFFRDRWLTTVAGGFVRAQTHTIVSRAFGHTRYTRMWIPRVGTDVFLQGQYDARMRLRLRVVAGVGARVDAVHRAPIRIWFGTGYMPEYEVNDTLEGAPHPARVVNHRWTSYGVVHLSPFRDARLALRDTVYVQPRFDDFTDIRVLQHVQLESAVTPMFALGTELQANYDSRPPAGVVPWDLSVGGYLRLRFQ